MMEEQVFMEFMITKIPRTLIKDNSLTASDIQIRITKKNNILYNCVFIYITQIYATITQYIITSNILQPDTIYNWLYEQKLFNKATTEAQYMLDFDLLQSASFGFKYLYNYKIHNLRFYLSIWLLLALFGIQRYFW